MKHLVEYITEKFKINKDINIDNYIEINTLDGDTIQFLKSKNEIKNKCFSWLAQHCQINIDNFKDEKSQKVDNVIYKATKYDNKNNFGAKICPEDKDLYDPSKIKYKHKEVSQKFNKEELDKDYYLGEIFAIKGNSRDYDIRYRNNGGELYFIPKSSQYFSQYGVMYNFIDDYPICIQTKHINDK